MEEDEPVSLVTHQSPQTRPTHQIFEVIREELESEDFQRKLGLIGPEKPQEKEEK